jgi:outer membrane usher protein
MPSVDSTSAATVPLVPFGPHGKPDINPYDRDIDMTVPVTFRARSLGDIPLRLTADDKFLLETATFLRLVRPILNAPAHARLSAALEGSQSFESEALKQTGVELTYDPSSLAVVVLEVSPEQRAIEQLFAARQDDLDQIDLQPAGISGYLNLNLAQTYLWGEEDVDWPTVSLDGAVRVGPVVFEGNGQAGRRFTLTGEDEYGFSRNYARLVYDQPDQYRRWYLGDLDPETRGLQSFVRMGGVGVLRQRRRFNTFRTAILQSDRQLVLQQESTVRFMRNGVLFRQLRLQPGRYDFSSLPLVTGSNDVDIEVTDNTGRVQSLSYQQYLDPIDLEPGDFEYGAYLGPSSARFGAAPDYEGPVVFTGFYRKAFINAPAVGVGLQLSEAVQNVTGQTQFVLPNSGRLLLDGGLSHSGEVGAGYSAGASYEHFFDRGGLSDSFSVRADYYSENYASLGNEEGFNSIVGTLSAQYARQFSLRTLGIVTASYQLGRGTRDDSYRVAATGFYKLDDRFTLRGGVDYIRSGSEFTRGNGWSVNVGIVFQPDYRRRAEARYESRGQIGELSYNQVGVNQLDSVGFGGVVGVQEGSVRAQAFGDYVGNRFDVGVSHSSLGSTLTEFGELNATNVRVGTSVAFADGAFGVGRRINDSFILLSAHENLGDRSVVAGQSLAENNYIGRSGTLGAAVNNFLASYVTQSVQYDVEDPPTGYDIGTGVVRVRPPYRSGYSLRIGTDAFVSAMGTLVQGPDRPVSLIGGRVTLLDVREGDNPQPIPFFTNSAGRFAVASLLPGRRYLVETYGSNGTIDRSFEFAIPADTDGLVNLGTVRPGTSN